MRVSMMCWIDRDRRRVAVILRPMSVAYLSDAWINAADDLLRAVRIDPPVAEDGFSIQVVVTDGPSGERSYIVTFAGDHMTAHRPAENEQATLRLTQRYETAVAIARGTLSAQAAFLDADIQLGGDVGTIIANAGLITQLGDALAPLRATTEFADHPVAPTSR